jgi:hypothetical protein
MGALETFDGSGGWRWRSQREDVRFYGRVGDRLLTTYSLPWAKARDMSRWTPHLWNGITRTR